MKKKTYTLGRCCPGCLEEIRQYRRLAADRRNDIARLKSDNARLLARFALVRQALEQIEVKG